MLKLSALLKNDNQGFQPAQDTVSFGIHLCLAGELLCSIAVRRHQHIDIWSVST